MAKQVKTKKELKSAKAKKEKTALDDHKKYNAVIETKEIESMKVFGVVFDFKKGKFLIKKDKKVVLSLPLKQVEDFANEIVEVLELWR